MPSANMVIALFTKTSLTRTDNNDPRGSTFKAMLGGTEYAFVEIRKGSLRGGHYHNIKTVQIVVKGKIRFEFVNPATKEQAEVVAGPMDVLEIPAGIAHLAEALEDSMFIEPMNTGTTTQFEPQREQIRKMLKMSKYSYPPYSLIRKSI